MLVIWRENKEMLVLYVRVAFLSKISSSISVYRQAVLGITWPASNEQQHMWIIKVSLGEFLKIDLFLKEKKKHVLNSPWNC